VIKLNAYQIRFVSLVAREVDRWVHLWRICMLMQLRCRRD